MSRVLFVCIELDDPAGRPVEEVRQIREEIGRRVADLAAGLPAD